MALSPLLRVMIKRRNSKGKIRFPALRYLAVAMLVFFARSARAGLVAAHAAPGRGVGGVAFAVGARGERHGQERGCAAIGGVFPGCVGEGWVFMSFDHLRRGMGEQAFFGHDLQFHMGQNRGDAFGN